MMLTLSDKIKCLKGPTKIYKKIKHKMLVIEIIIENNLFILSGRTKLYKDIHRSKKYPLFIQK